MEHGAINNSRPVFHTKSLNRPTAPVGLATPPPLQNSHTGTPQGK